MWIKWKSLKSYVATICRACEHARQNQPWTCINDIALKFHHALAVFTWSSLPLEEITRKSICQCRRHAQSDESEVKSDYTAIFDPMEVNAVHFFIFYTWAWWICLKWRRFIIEPEQLEILGFLTCKLNSCS